MCEMDGDENEDGEGGRKLVKARDNGVNGDNDGL